MSPKLASFLQHVLSNVTTCTGTLAASNTFPKWTPVFIAISSSAGAALAFWFLPTPPPKPPTEQK